MNQRISSVRQNYSHAAALEQLEDDREFAEQKRQAAQYRRERQVSSPQDYTNEYW
jgi:hypothetical protein